MAYISRDARWYLAEMVIEFTIEDDPSSIVHVSLVLVRADSPDEAYQSALELGKEYEDSYPNSDDKQVVVTFRGLRDLNVIHDEFGHGVELIYEEKLGLSEAEIDSLICPKNKLGVFSPRNQID